jgi:hypothetical protein
MISVIICSVDAGKFERISAHYDSVLAGREHEIVGIHDAKSMCEGYNRGLAKSRGELVVFSHDDIEILTPKLGERLTAHLGRYDGIGVAGTDFLIGAAWSAAGPPYIFGQVVQLQKATPPRQGEELLVCIYGAPRPAMGRMQALDGLFLAFRREVAEKVGWDEKTFTGFHCYDIDMTYRAYLAGYKLAVVNDLPILHASEGDYGSGWRQQAALFLRKHAGKLGRMIPRQHQFGAVVVATKEEAVKAMAPAYWEEGQE